VFVGVLFAFQAAQPPRARGPAGGEQQQPGVAQGVPEGGGDKGQGGRLSSGRWLAGDLCNVGGEIRHPGRRLTSPPTPLRRGEGSSLISCYLIPPSRGGKGVRGLGWSPTGMLLAPVSL
jgi:hypothetical protein